MAERATTGIDGVAPYVPVDGTPFRWTMGLHRLDLADWLEVDHRRRVELEEKRRLLHGERAAVLVSLPEGDAPSTELLALVVDHLVARDLVTEGDGTLVDRLTGERTPTAGVHPLEAAALVVQEDLCVLAHTDGEWRLVAACVCFPSRWSLTSKLGASLLGIHEPVPGFAEELARPATTFFDRLTVERPVWRLNWTLLDTAALHLPSSAARRRPPPPAEDLGDALWFRVERQTLRRLADTGAIVFTIRTHVCSLGDLVTASPSTAGALRATLATVAPDVAAYKGWTPLLAPLDEWLGAHGEPQ